MARCNALLPNGLRCQRKKAHGRQDCGIDHKTARPTVLGNPGGSLLTESLQSQFGGTASVGAKGEVLTARLLEATFAGDPDVAIFHDLRIPARPGEDMRANVDHVVLKGNRLLILDTKQWKPGFYWGLKRCYRGFRRFKPGDARTVPMAVDRYQEALQGTRVTVRGHLIIWPSTPTGRIDTWAWAGPPGVLIHVLNPGKDRYVKQRLVNLVDRGAARPNPEAMKLLKSMTIAHAQQWQAKR